MSRTSSLVMALAGLAIAASCAVLPPAPAPAPGRAPATGSAPHLLAETTAPHPSPSPSPSPSPKASPAPWWRGDLIQFDAPRRPGGDRDLFVYYAEFDTVEAVVGANSPDDETSPKLSSDRRWLAFQRTPLAEGAHADVLMLDTRSQLLHALKRLNTEAFDETNPDISRDGHWIAYVFSDDDGATSHLRLYDVEHGETYAFPAVDRAFVTVGGPRLSHDNEVIGFSASVLSPDGAPAPSDIHLYDIPEQALKTPAFVNSPYNEENPDLNSDGERLLFTSDRFGTRDLFEAHLDTGVVTPLAFANTALYDESNPRYYGKDDAYVRYRQFPRPADQPDDYVLRIYDPKTGNVDTLPIGNLLQLLPAFLPSPFPVP